MKEQFYDDLENPETDETESCDHEFGDVWKTFVFDPPRLERRCIHCGLRETPDR